MEKLIILDGDLYSKWRSINSILSSKLEFMYKHKDTKDEKILKEINENCSPLKLWTLQVKLNEIEKEWNKGYINI